MKRSAIIFAVILIPGCFSLQAQWTGTNPVYFTAGNVGIGTPVPNIWFGTKTFEMADTRPVFKLSSTSPAGLSTLVFTNTSVNGTSHTGEFHLNYHFNQSNNDQSSLRFTSYPSVDVLILQSDGKVGIGVPISDASLNIFSNSTSGHRIKIGDLGTGNKKASLFLGSNINQTNKGYYGLQAAPTGYAYDFALIGADDAAMHRYLHIGYNADDDPSGTFYPKVSINTYTGNVGIGVPDPDASLSIYSNLTTGKRIKIGDMGTGSKKAALFLGSNINQANKGYYGLQGAPTGYAYDFALIGADDAATHRYLHIGYNAGDDPSGTFYPKVSINTYTGNVGIGTTNPDTKLTVKGIIHTEEVRVDMNVPGPDYVFEKDYNLLPLSELETYITQNKHLPEVPSAKEMEAEGLNLKEMNLILLKKVEELTLHLIEMKKENDVMKKEFIELKQTIK